MEHLIPLKNNLLADQKYNDTVNMIVNRIRCLPNFMSYKQDAEVLLLICSLIEHLMAGDKIDKESMALDILNQIFNLSPEEIDLAKSSIKFLLAHKRVKKLSSVYVGAKSVWAYLKKKLA